MCTSLAADAPDAPLKPPAEVLTFWFGAEYFNAPETLKEKAYQQERSMVRRHMKSLKGIVKHCCCIAVCTVFCILTLIFPHAVYVVFIQHEGRRSLPPLSLHG